MDESPPVPASAEPPSRTSRRGFLIGSGVVIVAAAGGGAALGSRRPTRRPSAPKSRVPPADLVAAVAAERDLIAGTDAARAAHPELARVLAAVRADHVAHQQALQALVAKASSPATASASAGVSPPAPTPPALDGAGLRTAETRASAQAAARAARLTGNAATLLASIAACEASHAELLS